IELRTRAIDAHVRAARPAQLVLLGAGLDARAYRLPELQDTTVFEVDHPATQAYKRARISACRPLAREIRYVAVDFERDTRSEALVGSGHRSDLTTFWIWEGVVPYLRPAAIKDTLAQISRLSAKGSTVAVTYGTPEGTKVRGMVPFARAAFQALGEPLL